MPTAPLPPPIANPTLIVPFISAARAVLSTMVGVQTTVGRPFLTPQHTPTHDVSCIITFSGQITGSVVLSFQQQAALKLASAFAGTDLTPQDPDFADALGELANIVAGNARKDLGVPARISLPSVVLGHSHTFARLNGFPCLIVPCSTPVGDFTIEINIRRHDTGRPDSQNAEVSL